MVNQCRQMAGEGGGEGAGCGRGSDFKSCLHPLLAG